MVKQLTTAPMKMPEKTPSGEVITPALSALIFKCLERQPQRRVQSAGEILDGLAKLGVKGAIAEPAVKLKPKKARPAWVLPVIAGVVLLAGGAFAVWRYSGLAGSEDEKGTAAADQKPVEIPPPPAAVANAPLHPAPDLPNIPPPPAPVPTAQANVHKPSGGGHKREHVKHEHGNDNGNGQTPDDNTGMIDPFAN
jgi:hypothetical protein